VESAFPQAAFASEVWQLDFSRQRDWFAVGNSRLGDFLWEYFMESEYKENTLRNWFITDFEYQEKTCQIVTGNFHNRPGFYEGIHGQTSLIQDIKINLEEKEYEIQTLNTLYHCSFDSCFFERQDKSSYKLPKYKQIKKQYFIPTDISNLTEDDMILVVADFCDYFFKDLIFFTKNKKQGAYFGNVHLGMLVDTYLLSSKDDREIDIRWYVRAYGFEFYSMQTGNRNLWLENAGDNPLQIKVGETIINIEPKTREKIMMKK
jgi:hypothetical protein